MRGDLLLHRQFVEMCIFGDVSSEIVPHSSDNLFALFGVFLRTGGRKVFARAIAQMSAVQKRSSAPAADLGSGINWKNAKESDHREESSGFQHISGLSDGA